MFSIVENISVWFYSVKYIGGTLYILCYIKNYCSLFVMVLKISAASCTHTNLNKTGNVCVT